MGRVFIETFERTTDSWDSRAEHDKNRQIPLSDIELEILGEDPSPVDHHTQFALQLVIEVDIESIKNNFKDSLVDKK